MPETKEKKLFHSASLSRSLLATPRTANNHPVATIPQEQVTDFTDTQQLQLRAGDMRMARMQISVTRLRLEMEQSSKQLEQLCQEAQLAVKADRKQ